MDHGKFQDTNGFNLMRPINTTPMPTWECRPHLIQSAIHLDALNISSQSLINQVSGQRTIPYQTLVWTEPPPVTLPTFPLLKESLDKDGPQWELRKTRRSSTTKQRMLTITSTPHLITTLSYHNQTLLMLNNLLVIATLVHWLTTPYKLKPILDQTQSATHQAALNISSQSLTNQRTGQRTTVFQTSVWTEPPLVNLPTSPLPKKLLDKDGPQWEQKRTRRNSTTKQRMLIMTSPQHLTTKSSTHRTTSKTLSKLLDITTAWFSLRATPSALQLDASNTSTQNQINPRTGQRTTQFQTSVWTEPPPVTLKTSQLLKES